MTTPVVHYLAGNAITHDDVMKDQDGNIIDLTSATSVYLYVTDSAAGTTLAPIPATINSPPSAGSVTAVCTYPIASTWKWEFVANFGSNPSIRGVPQQIRIEKALM